MLDKLTKTEIQQLIGMELYGDIADFLEKLYQEESELFETNRKASQIKLLLSLSQNPKLYSPIFWRDCLSRCSPNEIQKLKFSGIDSSLQNKRLVEECLKFEYGKYDLQYVEKIKDEKLRPAITITAAPSSPFKTLKDFQTRIFWKIAAHLKIPRSRFIVQMPTGSGARSFIPLKVNSSGVMPIIFAQAIMFVPLYLTQAESFQNNASTYSSLVGLQCRMNGI